MLENKKINEVQTLLKLIHSLKNSKSQHSFRIMYLNIEFIESEDMRYKIAEEKVVSASYRLILNSPGRPALACNDFVNDYDLDANTQLYESFFANLVTIVEIYLSFATLAKIDHEVKGMNAMFNQSAKFFRLSKLIPKPEVLSLNLSCNMNAKWIFREFMEQNPMLQFISSLSLRMDNCGVRDEDMPTLNLLTKIFKLENLELSLEKNQLTDNAVNNLLFLVRFKQLKDVKIFLGGNKFTPEAIRRLNDEMKTLKFKIYDKL